MPIRLGYACINMHLSETQKITSSRTMRKATFEAKGLPAVSALIVSNLQSLQKIMQWNADNNFTLYRMSSDMFPWHSEYRWQDLPDYKLIRQMLERTGQFAIDNGIRLSFHPGQFVCLASKNPKVVDNATRDIEAHGTIMDWMLQPRDHNAKINIHIGGTYGGDFSNTADRWCRNFLKLSPNCQNRITVENDDKASMWSTRHLYDYVHKVIRIPIVFDYHHHRFCTGGQTESEAPQLAASTWHGVTPVVHLSESRREEQRDNKIKEQAHSDYIYKPVDNYGVKYDMMLECKMKEVALLKYRSILENEELVV